MDLFPLLLAHLLVLYFISAPVFMSLASLGWIPCQVRPPASRSHAYLRYMRTHWSGTIGILVVSLRLGWFPHALGIRPPTHTLPATLVTVCVLIFLSALSLSLRKDLHNPKERAFLLKNLDSILPSTRHERILFIPVSITAGICEELTFRGFIPAYLTHLFPGLSFLLAFAISACFFSLGHLRQKAKGVIASMIFGMCYGLLAFWTNSILFCMLIHAYFDVRLLLIDPAHGVNPPARLPEKPLPSSS